MKRLRSVLRLKRRRKSAGPYRKKIIVALVTALVLVLIPSGSANADSAGIDWSKLNPISGVFDIANSQCANPSMDPEMYNSGFDGMAQGGNKAPDASYYGQYGTAGQYWNWMGQKCTDFAMPIGNASANLIFDVAKTIDTVTITVYKAAVEGSLIGWLKNVSDGLIHSIGKALQVGYITLVIMLGALALIWWGLFKRRATRVTEGTIWMVCATAAFLLLVNRPELFTTAGSWITGGTEKVVDAALSPMQNSAATGGVSKPVPKAVINGQSSKPVNQAQTVCIPTSDQNNPQYKSTNWTTGQNADKWNDVDKNANTMWSVLVCKPWLQGEFGTANPSSLIVQSNADKLLQSQAFKRSELDKPAKDKAAAIQNGYTAKGEQFHQVAENVKKQNGDAGLFTGKAYAQRIGIAFAALFAAVVAGILILLLSLALIIFKLGFLLLLVTGPVFLLIGIHPGWGRVIAVRWVELLLSSLLKQALVAGLLALLLFMYALIMGAGGLSWVMQIVLIALVSFAAFFYRKPFQHLFAAVGTDSIGSRILSNATAGTNAFKTGTGALTAPSRVNKWTLRKTQPMTDAAAATGHPAAMGVAMASRLATGNPTDDDVSGRTAGRIAAGSRNGDGSDPSTGTTRSGGGNRAGTNAPPLNLPRPGDNNQNGPNRPGGPGTSPRGGVRPGGGPTTVGPRSGPGSGNAPVTTGAGWGPRPGDAPPIWSTRSSGGAPPRNPSGGTPSRNPSNAPAPSNSGGTPPAPAGSGGGSSPRSGSGGGWFGSSWRRSGGDGPSRGGGDGGSRRSGGGGGWFGGGGGGSSRRGGGGEKRESTPPPRRTENRDTSSGPAPWRKRESAPPLWAKPSKPQTPDIPFWTRPDK